MRELAEAGLLDGRRVNLGGLHAGEERRRVLPYVHLASRDVADLEAIAERSGRITARDLPAAREVSLEELIRAAR
jgi:mannose/fructose/N-acetylgalactosamine-specific phosphotransferase system component IIB